MKWDTTIKRRVWTFVFLAVGATSPAFGGVRSEVNDGPRARGIRSATRDTTFHVMESLPTGCAIEGVGNCQMCDPDPETVDSFVLLSDLTVPPVGAVHADDFTPNTRSSLRIPLRCSIARI